MLDMLHFYIFNVCSSIDPSIATASTIAINVTTIFKSAPHAVCLKTGQTNGHLRQIDKCICNHRYTLIFMHNSNFKPTPTTVNPTNSNQ